MVRKAPPMSKKNEELLAGFIRSKTHCKETTIRNIRALFRIFANWLDKPLDKATKEDILDFVMDFKKRTKTSSQILMITMIKDFYKWLYSLEDPAYKKPGKYPPIVEDLKRPRKKKPLKEYPTAEELLKIISCCQNLKEKALIAVGYETATAGRAKKELLNMKIGDIILKNNCAYIKIPESKSEPRTTVVKKFINEFRAWLDAHPNADNPNAYLWPSSRTPKMSYPMTDTIFKRACKRAGVKAYPLRSLRHRRAKDLEDVLGIREKMAYFGWSTITTAQVYGDFTSEESCEKIVANAEGRPVRGEEELKEWKCPGCGNINSPAARFCGTCSQPKDDLTAIKASSEVEVKVENVMELLVQRMISNPEFKEQLASMLLNPMVTQVTKQKIKTEV